MSLIDEIAKLRGLEQEIAEFQKRQSMPSEDIDRWGECENELIKAVPAMLEILGCFQEGDASGIKLLIAWLDEMQKNSDFVISPDHMQRLRRLQKAAALMERK